MFVMSKVISEIKAFMTVMKCLLFLSGIQNVV